ncbi:MAG: tight adherence protein B [Lysobacterales bacterium]|jgi:tight adherence protein B
MLIPVTAQSAVVYNKRRKNSIAGRMEGVLPKKEAQKIVQMLILAPLGLALLLFILIPGAFKLPATVAGFVAGLIIPSLYINFLKKKTIRKFHDQLVDALMIMSSSFRGGLSLIQAVESVVEEMPDPIRREFSIVLGENKMGVSLEEALNHLYSRMPSSALQQMNTSILLARETGGNLPVIFSRIITNIRETKKIQQNIDTLTIQGKIQGVVLTLLPIGFIFIIFTSNRRIFDHMLTSPTGQKMLIVAAILWVLGAFMIIKISTFKDY